MDRRRERFLSALRSDHQRRAKKVAPLTVFISHASQDIIFAQAIRNYLEQRGAKAILFHLISLKHPILFWPLIAREIRARSFFLCCESAAAEASKWVRREREYVQKISKTRPIRIGRVAVPPTELSSGQSNPRRVYVSDFADLWALPHEVKSTLDKFIARSNVELACEFRDRKRLSSYEKALVRAGFRIQFVCDDGVIVRFLSRETLRSEPGWRDSEAEICVLLDDCPEVRARAPEEATIIVDGGRGPQELVRRLLADGDQGQRA